MSLVGTRIASYELLSLLGAGGMGEVYRARDLKLGRDVAIKVLPPSFATDPDRLVRFEREARTLASLNHPHIAQIYGLEGREGPFDFDQGRLAGQVGTCIVMELVEGEDLSQRLARGPMPIAEALAVARQIADAMQTAHDLGIIHRDLKPANVKVKPGGTVKVLDFGLAKVGEAAPANISVTQSPTIMTSVPGILLGTAAYIKGQAVDARSDVWAFGCVLFEMLTGRAAYAAPTTSEILANVLTKEADWRLLPADTPQSVRRLLRRCLQKDEAHRLRAIADARLEIDETDQPDDHTAPARHSRPSRAERLVWTGAVAALVVAVLVLGLRRGQQRPPPPPEIRFDITTPPAADPVFLPFVALSPDGRQILFLADSDGQPHIWLRAINSISARPLAGTGGAVAPFWSPDGRSVAFFADGFLKRLDLDGGLVRSLAKALIGVGGTWSRDGVILFVRNPASTIARVSAEGGPAVDATRLDAGQIGHTFPQFLPDGKHFLYYVAGAPETRGIQVGQLDGAASRRLLDADAAAAYTNGHLLFIRQRNVFAQAFDADRLELSGSPFQVADGVFSPSGAAFLITLSASSGAFAFRAGDAQYVRQFTWVDRAGHQIATVGDGLSNADGISFSPDRSQVVFFQRGATSSDLWTLDTRRGVLSRLTDDPDEDIFPLWARDGRIIYTVVRNGQVSLYQRDPAANSRELLLVAPPAQETFASDTSPDGRYVIYQRFDPKTGWDILALPREPNATPIPIVQTDADERGARLSPDGRWVAYVSNDSGVSEIYVQPFQGPGRRLRISPKGGDQPQWRPDGAELFYIALDGRLMAAPVTPAADRQALDVGAPVPLFVVQAGAVVSPVLTSNFIPSVDGQRFLVNRLVGDTRDRPVRVVLNWSAAQQPR